jgi:pimeloyl-ACP methyl ester carboxylesterase
VVEEHLAPRTQVCSYDRAGKGSSDPASTPRPVSEVISDAHAFLAQAANQGAKPPYFLVGVSFGGEVVFLYAQAHPDQVAGFVSINPSPPYKTWLKRVRTVQTEAEIREFEEPFPRGENDEGIDTRSDESMLTDSLPADMPYAVMFDASCEELPPPLQNQKDCTRMVRLLELTAKDLAKVGKGGRYVRVKGAGHNINLTQPEVVLATVDQVWKAALGR